MQRSAHYVLEKALAMLLGLFLLAAVIRGGNVDAVILAALYLAVPTAAVAAATHFSAPDAPPASAAAWCLWAAIGLLCLAVLAGLMPLSNDVWLSLPGRRYYEPVLAVWRASSPGETTNALALSLDPDATRRALLIAVTCLVVAMAMTNLGRRTTLQLLGALAMFVTFEALIGLVQLGFAGAFTFGYAGHSRATGTFVNKNHFATMLAMALPLLLMRATGQFTFFVPHTESGPMGRAWWGAATAVVIVSLIASSSRAGIIAAVITSSICAYLIWRRKRQFSRPALVVGGLLAVLAVGLGWITGFRRLLSSLLGTGASDGLGTRTLMNAHTWDGITAFFPLGSGIGSYAIAFPRFQTDKLGGFIEYAHNDYLQLIFEAGLVGVLILLLLAVSAYLTVQLALRLGDQFARLGPGVACLLGAAAFAIHAWFDFPAHIPAIAIMAAMLYGAATNPAVLASGQRRKPPVQTTIPDTFAPIAIGSAERVEADVYHASGTP